MSTKLHTDEELIELGRSSLLESPISKPPSVFKRAWDEVKEPWSITIIFIIIICAIVLNVFACIMLVGWMLEVFDDNVIIASITGVVSIILSVGAWWYGVAILVVMDNTDE